MEVSVASAPPRGWCSIDVWPWRGSSIGPRKARSSILTVKPPRGCSTGWFRYAPKGARFPAGPRSLRRALSPEDRWETRQLRPCRKVSESISLGHSEEPPTVPLPKERPRVRTRGWDQDRPATPEGVPLAATCTTLKEPARHALWHFPKEVLEGRPRRAPSARTLRRRPEGLRRFALARSFRRRTASLARHGNVHRSG